jgi:hypothetical protein
MDVVEALDNVNTARGDKPVEAVTIAKSGEVSHSSPNPSPLTPLPNKC